MVIKNFYWSCLLCFLLICNSAAATSLIPDIKTSNVDLYFINGYEYKKPSGTCRTSACQALLNEINSAQKSISFAIYGIANQPEIFNALINAQKRGVIVRGVTDMTENNTNYYSDTELEYRLGLTKAKPNTIVIYTNGETTRMRRVMVGSQRIILRKPRTKIDKFNASVLCFLELMNGIDVETLDEYKRKLISDYITENRITQKQITKYIPYFPDKTCRNLIESEVIYRVPQ